MPKKLYWLKLKSDYFDSIKMKKLRQMAGGAVFTLIYLKMQLLALKSDGIIVFEKVEDSFAKELALQLDEAVEDIEMTLLYLQKVDLIDVNQDCDTYFLPEVIANTGSESESAERVRKHRNKINSLHCNNEVTESNLLETSSTGIVFQRNGYVEGSEVPGKGRTKRYKRKRTSISCSAETHELICAAAREAGVSVSNYFVRAAIEKARGAITDDRKDY